MSYCRPRGFRDPAPLPPEPLGGDCTLWGVIVIRGSLPIVLADQSENPKYFKTLGIDDGAVLKEMWEVLDRWKEADQNEKERLAVEDEIQQSMVQWLNNTNSFQETDTIDGMKEILRIYTERGVVGLSPPEYPNDATEGGEGRSGGREVVRGKKW